MDEPNQTTHVEGPKRKRQLTFVPGRPDVAGGARTGYQAYLADTFAVIKRRHEPLPDDDDAHDVEQEQAAYSASWPMTRDEFGRKTRAFQEMAAKARELAARAADGGGRALREAPARIADLELALVLLSSSFGNDFDFSDSRHRDEGDTALFHDCVVDYAGVCEAMHRAIPGAGHGQSALEACALRFAHLECDEGDAWHGDLRELESRNLAGRVLDAAGRHEEALSVRTRGLYRVVTADDAEWMAGNIASDEGNHLAEALAAVLARHAARNGDGETAWLAGMVADAIVHARAPMDHPWPSEYEEVWARYDAWKAKNGLA